MAFPAEEVPTEDPSRTGRDGNAGTLAVSADPDANIDADADMGVDADADAGIGVDAKADADAISRGDKEAYAPPPTDTSATTGSGTPADAGPSVNAVASQRWNQIQATFVDDPLDSVTQAAGMVDEAIEALIAAARKRQAWLASSWQGPEAGTEELRIALQGYHVFWSSITGNPQSA